MISIVTLLIVGVACFFFGITGMACLSAAARVELEAEVIRLRQRVDELESAVRMAEEIHRLETELEALGFEFAKTPSVKGRVQ